MLEELGHSIDWKLHPDLDTPGDEGELFSDLVRGVALSESELQRLKTEDDSVIVSIDREVVRLEQASEVFLRNFKAPRGLVVDNQQNLLVSETDILYPTFRTLSVTTSRKRKGRESKYLSRGVSWRQAAGN